MQVISSFFRYGQLSQPKNSILQLWSQKEVFSDFWKIVKNCGKNAKKTNFHPIFFTRYIFKLRRSQKVDRVSIDATLTGLCPLGNRLRQNSVFKKLQAQTWCKVGFLRHVKNRGRFFGDTHTLTTKKCAQSGQNRKVSTILENTDDFQFSEVSIVKIGLKLIFLCRVKVGASLEFSHFP